MARTVKVGAQDFSKIIEKGCFYVDKTDFIKEWWENEDDVTLITRPRRFGKTLNMSMLEQFFSVKYEGRSDLFEGLSIWAEEKYRRIQGTYPVIFLSFADVKGNNFETVREKICQLIADLYDDYRYILGKSTDEGYALQEREFFMRVSDTMNDAVLSIALKRLSKYLYEYYDRKVIILLDEYDTPMQEAYVCGYWDEMAALIRGLFNSAFKSNPYLERGLMTGITRISKESIFSDLNNLEVVTTASGKYQTSFGFTEKEVFLALNEFGLHDVKQKVKEWYDGFRFGDCDNIYNPWSIINFLDKRKFAPYWANTSSNALIGKLIQEGSLEVKIIMEDLLGGNTFRTQLDEEIIFKDLNKKKSAVWSLLLASGYLKLSRVAKNRMGDEEYELSLTNAEVFTVFKNLFAGWFSNKAYEYSEFCSALLSGDKEFMNEYLRSILEETVSFYDAGTRASRYKQPENFYHGLVLGLITSLRKIYKITSNRESGFGRYDVVLEPRSPKQDDAVILEFKIAEPEKEKSMEDTVRAALEQIIDKKYAADLMAGGIVRDSIRMYGFAFSGKEVLVDGGYIAEYV